MIKINAPGYTLVKLVLFAVFISLNQASFAQPCNPVITANGSTQLNCGGGSVQLSAPTATGRTYHWYRYDVPVYPLSSGGNNTFLADHPGDYKCMIYTPGCGTQVSNIITITGAASISANGFTNFCGSSFINNSVQLIATQGASSYQWKQNGVDIPGEVFQTYTVNTSGSYTCSVSNSCGTTISNSITTDANASSIFTSMVFTPPVNWSQSSFGVVNTCNAPPTLSVYPEGESYQWTLDGAPILGANGPSLQAAQPGDYTCQVIYGCEPGGSYSSTTWYPVHSLPAPSLTICEGPLSSVCAKELVVGAAFSPGCSHWASYQWQRNGADIPGATNFDYLATASGSYRCLVSNGCLSQYTDASPITVNSATASITPNGSLNFCNGSGITLQANTGTGLTYQWRKNSVNISSATNSSYLANSTGTFNVVVTNNSGCSKGATPVNVTSPPSITITPSGPAHFCTAGNVTLTATSGQTVTYKWKKNGAYLTGATNATYVANSTGSYNCVLTNSFGCSKGGTPVAVTGPPSAVITANGSTTFCAGGSVQLSAASGYTYQWIKNSGNIPGASQQNYTVTTAGNYKVKVTDPFGCSKTTPNTNQITVNVPCREGLFLNDTYDGINIYPNPSSGIIEIMIPSSQNKNTEIEIYSPDGRQIKKQIVEASNPFTIDLTQQADGIYFIQFKSDEKFIRQKVIKQQ